jgi:hypothetical protein
MVAESARRRAPEQLLVSLDRLVICVNQPRGDGRLAYVAQPYEQDLQVRAIGRIQRTASLSKRGGIDAIGPLEVFAHLAKQTYGVPAHPSASCRNRDRVWPALLEGCPPATLAAGDDGAVVVETPDEKRVLAADKTLSSGETARWPLVAGVEQPAHSVIPPSSSIRMYDMISTL